MRNGLSFAALISFLVISCEISEPIPSPSSQDFEARSVTQALDDFLIQGSLDFPDQTQFSISGNTLWITLPDGYGLLYTTETGDDGVAGLNSGSVGVTCTCTDEDGGCNPAKMGGNYGCIIYDPCGSCDKSIIVDGQEESLDQLAVVSMDDHDVVLNFSQVDGAHFFPFSLMETGLMTDFLNDFVDALPEANDPLTTTVILFQAFGYIINLEIPAELDDTSVHYIGNGSNDKTTCSCLVGESCPLKSVVMVGKYCDAENCKSCEMSGIVGDDQGNTAALTSPGGIITLN